LPPEIVSTGLPYAIVPIRRSIENAGVAVGNLGAILDACGAKFIYVYDVAQSEGRTWDNKVLSKTLPLVQPLDPSPHICVSIAS
jgi:hypothetical protein